MIEQRIVLQGEGELSTPRVADQIDARTSLERWKHLRERQRLDVGDRVDEAQDRAIQPLGRRAPNDLLDRICLVRIDRLEYHLGAFWGDSVMHPVLVDDVEVGNDELL